jgi:hypothetical protein
MRKTLVQIKVDPETRRRVRVLASEDEVEMGEIIRLLVEREWIARGYPSGQK